jgi:hypothetical protein
VKARRREIVNSRARTPCCVGGGTNPRWQHHRTMILPLMPHHRSLLLEVRPYDKNNATCSPFLTSSLCCCSAGMEW